MVGSNPDCPTCGLPMSYADYGEAENAPVWICDGPNDETTERGCGEIVETKAA